MNQIDASGSAQQEQAPAVKTGMSKGIVFWMVVCHLLGTVGAYFFFSWGAVVAALIMWVITGTGITLGYHRLLSHRSLKANKWVERIWATFGNLALQGGPFMWVSHHRMHHSYTDRYGDPHNARLGFWHSHMGWILVHGGVEDDVKLQRKFGRDILADPYLMWLGKPSVMIGLQVVLGLGFLFFGGWDYVMWAIFARLTAGYHITWFVNSATHKWGYRNYETDDLSRNNWWVAVLAFGEGWHNNHHAHQEVCPAGHKWWEFDFTWQIVKVLRACGWVWDVKLPPEQPPVVVVEPQSDLVNETSRPGEVEGVLV